MFGCLANPTPQTQTGKDALAVAMRGLHACHEQSEIRKRRQISNPDTPHSTSSGQGDEKATASPRLVQGDRAQAVR